MLLYLWLKTQRTNPLKFQGEWSRDVASYTIGGIHLGFCAGIQNPYRACALNSVTIGMHFIQINTLEGARPFFGFLLFNRRIGKGQVVQLELGVEEMPALVWPRWYPHGNVWTQGHRIG